jgi:hypothetical protein
MHWKTSLTALLIATTFGASVSGVPSWAAASEKQQLDQAGADIQAGKYKEGAAAFKSLADKGNPFAQCIMGVMCQNGRGVPKDIHQAVDWYTKSAKQGFAGAEEHLGEIYRDGTDGMRKDTNISANWFRRAAFHGDGKAQLALGKMFMASHTPHESNEAKIWLARAFETPGHIGDEAHKAFMTLPGMQDMVKAQNNYQFAIANLAVGGTLQHFKEKKSDKSGAELLAGLSTSDKSSDGLLNMSEKSSGKSSEGVLNFSEKSGKSSLSDDSLSKFSDKSSKFSDIDVSKLSDKVSDKLADKPRVPMVVPPAGMPSGLEDKWGGYSAVEKSLGGM